MTWLAAPWKSHILFLFDYFKYAILQLSGGFPGGSVVKTHSAKQEMQVQSLGWEDPLEEEIATYSSILAWKIPWTEGPRGLQSMGSQELDTT